MSDAMSYMLKMSTGQMMTAMAGTLAKAAAHAKAAEIEESVFLGARLYPDMFPMSKQVQIACDVVTRGGARLAGLELPEYPDTETSFAELIARTETSNAFVQGLDDDALNASEHREMEIELGPMTVNWPGRQYLATFILPNLHFHAGTAYGLLRHQGVVLGKKEFLMG